MHQKVCNVKMKMTKGLKKYFSEFNQVIYSSLPIYFSNFKALASIGFEIFCRQDFVHIFLKGHNSGKGHYLDKINNTYQLFFHEVSKHKISKP